MHHVGNASAGMQQSHAGAIVLKVPLKKTYHTYSLGSNATDIPAQVKAALTHAVMSSNVLFPSLFCRTGRSLAHQSSSSKLCGVEFCCEVLVSKTNNGCLNFECKHHEGSKCKIFKHRNFIWTSVRRRLKSDDDDPERQRLDSAWRFLLE
jgi:hypothetical protein